MVLNKDQRPQFKPRHNDFWRCWNNIYRPHLSVIIGIIKEYHFRTMLQPRPWF